jgi:CHAT domain-containing protein/tetratricopeptide (TPR) repeat protein
MMAVLSWPIIPLCLLSFIAGPDDGGQVAAETQRARERVRLSLDIGAYADAERNAAELIAIVEAERNSDSLELAYTLDLYVEALYRNGKASLSSTLDLAERAVRLKEQLLGRDHLETAISLHNLGAVDVERGEFKTAVPLHERALAIRLNQLAPDDPAIADSLDYLAFPLIRLQQFDEARRRLEQAQRIRDAFAERSPASLARTLELAAVLQRYAGNYRAAMPMLDRALVIRRRVAPDHPETASALHVRGDLLWLGGDIVGAQGAWAEALAIGERALGPDHPAILLYLRKLGGAAGALGNLPQSLQLLERALLIGQRWLAPCHPEIPGLLNDFASQLRYHGDYDEARKLYQQALSTRERCLGPNHSLTATVVYNQAELAVSIGDLAQAEKLYERAVRAWSASLGSRHPYVARGLDALAGVATSRGNYARGRTLYERALTIRRGVGADHPDVAWTLTNLARTVAQMGERTVALRYLDEAIAIYQRVGVSDEPDHLARALTFRGELEMGDDPALARATLAEALQLRERIFGVSHPLAAETRAELAGVDFARGSYEAALPAALEAEQAGREHLRFTIRYLPEREAMAYAVKRPRGLDLALSVVATGRVDEPSQVFDAVIQSRGVILDELAARARSSVGRDPELAALNASLTQARERFANLMLRSMREDESVSRALLDETRQQKEDAERALAERSVTMRAELARARAGLDEVRRALPGHSALVSFIRYDRTSVRPRSSQAGPALRTVPSYLAFVIRSESPTVAAIPLGSAAAIDAEVKAWRIEAAGRSIASGASASEAERTYRTVGAQLRRRVWDPLAAQLRDATHVFIVPDGALNLVSFAALPIDGQRYLGDRSQVVHYASTERDLLPTEGASENRGLLAVGGAAFNAGVTSAATGSGAQKPLRANENPHAGSDEASASRRSGCGDLRSVQFSDLPGSRNEVAEVARLWPDVRMLTGRAATEDAVKSGVAGRQVVHLATHGFFLGSDCESGMAGTRAVGALSSGPRRSVRGLADNPLLLSGLALSGANLRTARKANQDDGILTGEEVAALNLQGTEWAVLSACDTGLGEVKAGEGVFGLRRAFQIAGAHTVIMSLWAVDDQAARLWMRTLYEGRMKRHLSTADAMHEATSKVLRARRAGGQSTHPFYWAGFVAAGDWR